MSMAVRRSTLRSCLVVASVWGLLGAHPVLASSPASPAAPEPTSSPTSTAPVTATPEPQVPAGPATAPTASSQASGAKPGGAGSPQASAGSRPGASPSSAGAPPTAATSTGQGGAQQAAASPGGGGADQQASSGFCPQLSFSPLSSCQSLPAPVRAVGLAPSGTPLFVGLLGLLLIAAGVVLYRRPRRASPERAGAAESAPATEERPSDGAAKADVHGRPTFGPGRDQAR
jgi:hypothetical protein